ncbi:ATP-binding cassette domain-containing protein [Collinsella sp. zg1085]|uniref:ABC-F family ATP-binding cassette domain-containing protein n=1 Tax=Collinsella sp. zg1085 TaxID=2844380 RepID=UPI001C0C0D67|nr:ABC-F family ATP-binding cassette domain-containing protein [Collinsella sp. zg1085]QWT17205.1 ATP-binding cassette domain-containing protein [Collinsella sp. zg1085]
MGVLLGCDQVSLEFPTKQVLQQVTLSVHEGDRIGVVGANGEGKSSLLSVLALAIEPDEGRVTYKRDTRVGLLSQRDQFEPELSVQEAVVGNLPAYEWASDARVRDILDGLLGNLDLHATISSLSGGQRRRVDLARLLIGSWDVLMLDEPTNHLDMRTIHWLAQHLKHRWQRGSGGLVLVTHDRWFLDEVCTSMWEVHDGVVDPFEGGYSAYILQRVERDRQAHVSEERRRNMARKELAWLSRGAQARSTKPKFRVDAARALIADVPPLRDELELKRLAVARLGKRVIDLFDVVVQYPHQEPILKGVTWRIGAGDRFGLLGANGAGKTTLIEAICKQLTPQSGQVRIGSTVHFGMLSQQLYELEPYETQTIREVLAKGRRVYVIDGKETSPEKLCERLGFSAAQLMNRICDLSGGQRRRLALLLTILAEPNVLILDEPGNDLDTDMLGLVEDLLDGWPGTLILVTHDRFLMERVTDHQFALLEGTLRHVPGGVDEYLRLAAELERANRTAVFEQACMAAQSSQVNEGESAAIALSNAERQQLRRQASSLERRITSRHEQLDMLTQALLELDQTDYQALTQAQEEINAAQLELDEMETEWLELEERLEG